MLHDPVRSPPASPVPLATILSTLLWIAGVAAAILLMVFLGGCGGVDVRAAQMRALFVDFDRELAAARPSLVADKYRTMASGRYEFLRGSATLFYADATRFSGSPALLHVADTDHVPLFGDLHLENIGTAPTPTTTVFEVTDFDASILGPIDWDVRRAVLGLAVLDGLRTSALDASVATSHTEAWLAGYERGLTDSTLAEAGPIAREQLGEVVGALLTDADEKLSGRNELVRYTQVVAGQRRILRNEQLVDVASPWSQGLADALVRWSATRRGGSLGEAARGVKDIARRLDAGVASLALHRFYVLLEMGAGNDDDVLLEIKEELDPPSQSALIGRGALIDGPYPGEPIPDNAARVVAGATRLLASAAAEPDFGRTTWNGVSFLVRTASRARINLDTAELTADAESGKLSETALTQLANDCGRLVGRAHGVSLASATTGLLRALDPPAHAAIAARAIADASQLADDHTRFVGLLAEYGPLLSPPSLAY